MQPYDDSTQIQQGIIILLLDTKQALLIQQEAIICHCDIEHYLIIKGRIMQLLDHNLHIKQSLLAELHQTLQLDIKHSTEVLVQPQRTLLTIISRLDIKLFMELPEPRQQGIKMLQQEIIHLKTILQHDKMLPFDMKLSFQILMGDLILQQVDGHSMRIRVDIEIRLFDKMLSEIIQHDILIQHSVVQHFLQTQHDMEILQFDLDLS